MGGGAWSTPVYDSLRTTRLSTGTPHFAYSAYVHDSATPASARKVHDSLDVKGLKMRESRDSDEHPTTVAVAFFFDVTGSMHRVPSVLQEKVPHLMEALLLKGVLEHPQIMPAAFGDATCDSFPIQVGQFESDIRIDEHLRNIILEGGGGGSKHESSELALYIAARHTALDCWEKRGHKGYLFIVTDEMAYEQVARHQVQTLIEDGLEADVSLDTILAEAQEKYEVFVIHPMQGSYSGDSQVHNFWRDRIGQNFVTLDDAEAVCETVAMLIGSCEGIDIHDTASALVAVGASTSAVATASRAVANYTSTSRSVEIVDCSLAPTGPASVERL